MSKPPPNLAPPPDPNHKRLISVTSTSTLPSSYMAREYRKGNWTLQETLVLITAKNLNDQRRLKTTTSARNSGEQRWKWVENYCWSHGCFRSQNQCNDKWDNLLRDYKKVRDYEAKSEFPSYWTIQKHQRKDRKLPSNMLLQVYQAVTQVLQRKLHSHPHPPHHLINPPQHVPLQTTPLQSITVGVATQSPPLLLPPQAPAAVSEGSEYNDEDDNSESKRRKFEKLGSSIMRSASELARALGSCEEKKETRHREMMEIQQRRLQMEETRNQMNQQGITTLVTAVTDLTCAIESLINVMTDGKNNGDNLDACSS